jgi:hypothetical protein
MVALVIDEGWTIEATAERFQVDAKTVTTWRNRFRDQGPDGLFDRSSRPHRSPNATPPECRRRIIEMRTQRRWGANHIGFEVGRAASTVQKILIAEGLGRLDSSDRATKEPVIRYQRDRPGASPEHQHTHRTAHSSDPTRHQSHQPTPDNLSWSAVSQA